MNEKLTKEILFNKIREICEEQFLFPKKESEALKIIRSSDRRKEYVKVRQAVTKLLRNEFDWSFPRIGRFLNRDHTSAMHLYYKN